MPNDIRNSRLYALVCVIILSSIILLVPLSLIQAQPALPTLPIIKPKVSRSTTQVKQATLMLRANAIQAPPQFYKNTFDVYLNDQNKSVMPNDLSIQCSTNLLTWVTVTNYRYGLIWTNKGKVTLTLYTNAPKLFWRTLDNFHQ